MKNILVMAYAISPTRGSEYCVAWNFVQQMSRNNRLTVLYGASGDHMGDCEEMEEYARTHSHPNIRYVRVEPNRMANLLNYPNRHHVLIYTFYYAYRVWQKLAYRKALELMNEESFDLVHFVGMIGYREPGYLWKLGLPYVWGPISGANNSPVTLMKHLPFSGKLKHGFRSLANTFQLKHNARLRDALKATDVLLTATSENQSLFKSTYGVDSYCLPENAIVDDIIKDNTRFEQIHQCRLISVGTIDDRKNLILLLEALCCMKYRDKVMLDIVGDGPLRESLQVYAHDNGLDSQITWHGKLPRERVVEMYQHAHLHVITSISEGNPTTIWEAMVEGVPTLSFDHCGMHDTLRDGAGVLVPIASTYEANVHNFAESMDSIVSMQGNLKLLSDKTLERAHHYTWESRRVFFENIYMNL